MELQFSKVMFTPDPAAWKHFTQAEGGTVGSDLRRRGRHLVVLAKRTAGKDTGELIASITMTYHPGRNPTVRVGSNVPHALMHHNGTRPHIILPEDQRLLKFRAGGKVIYARRVEHPGTRGSFYLTRHLRKVVK